MIESRIKLNREVFIDRVYVYTCVDVLVIVSTCTCNRFDSEILHALAGVPDHCVHGYKRI